MTGDRAAEANPGGSLGDELSVASLRAASLTDLVDLSDREGTAYVETYLEAALEVADSFVVEHGIRLENRPEIEYDPYQSGVTYDPYYGSAEALIIGGPRGVLQGGYQTLMDHGYIEHTSLLNVLTKGLLHSYHQQLADEHFERHGTADTPADAAGMTLYDEYRMLVPAVDEGFAQMFSLHVDGDITDAELRRAYIADWAEWYDDFTDMDLQLFRAVAGRVSDLVDEADGPAAEAISRALRIQEALVRDADVSVISERLE